MSSDFYILRKLISDDGLIFVKKNDYGEFFLELSEPGIGGTGYKIQLLNPPTDTIAIKSDLFPPPRRIFKNTKGECRRADFVILSMDNKTNSMVYIELKLGNSESESKIIQQLQGSKCFMDYCRAIGQTFWKDPKFLEKNNYKERFVTVKNIGANKKTLKHRRKPVLHDTPENMLKISTPPSQRLQFKELLA
ncbi:MAG: hypothetical protein OXF08_03610 [Bacteroidetes bacterium]|nr:hypothetical protein [Bacteroidota bacterium]